MKHPSAFLEPPLATYGDGRNNALLGALAELETVRQECAKRRFRACHQHWRSHRKKHPSRSSHDTPPVNTVEP